ncbi:MAG: pyruvate kinase, partial [Candidatus Spechtbacterales bacterium]|nr:pyruvate kinase [Candidatus Spechtbacterales bacterium]
LADLSGPKIRIGKVKEDTTLNAGDEIKISKKSATGDKEAISINFSSILKGLKPGTTIFLGDGDIILKAKRKVRGGVMAEVLAGGKMRSSMGFLAQDISLGGSMITKKDKEDINALSNAGVTAFAVSFVQSKKEIKQVRRRLPEEKALMVIAKIETPKAVKNVEEIMDEADGIMIARGDLGLSMPMEKIPQIQKELIELGRDKAKIVITATQMLESMKENPLPTRAEVTDVATAVLEGTDAVMFSAETATGKYPLRTIEMAKAIIKSTEGQVYEREFTKEDNIADAISASVTNVAKEVEAKLIIVLTESGRTARLIARHRQDIPIVAMSPHEATTRKLNFIWGVYPHKEARSSIVHNFKELTKETQKVAKSNRILKLKKGDIFVIGAGVPFEEPGTTNLLLVEKVK